MLYIIFLILSVVFLLLKKGLFGINLNINFDLIRINTFFLKLRARISPVTICLTAAWFTGLNKVIEEYVAIPVWAALLVIFIVLPSIFATLFEKDKQGK